MEKSKLKITTSLFITVALLAGPLQPLQAAGVIEGKVKVTRSRNSADVVVYLETVGDNNFDPPEQNPVMDQQKLTFVPHILPVLKGTIVDFINSDDVKHNIFSKDEVAGKFNLGTYSKGVVKTQTFDKLGEAQLMCNVHSEMSAYVVVFPNPFFVKTDRAGSFKLEDVPPGKYTLKTWHEKMKSVSEEISVEDGKTATVDLVLKRRR